MHTIAEIIEALGGGAEICRAMGWNHRSRVSMWRRNGIPREVWPELIELAVVKGLGEKITLATLKAANAALESGCQQSDRPAA